MSSNQSRGVLSALLLIFTMLLLTAMPAVHAEGRHSPKRAYAIDDVFSIEALGKYFGGPFAFSTDGKRLAFVRVRPGKGLVNYKLEFLFGNAGGDVWVQDGPAGPAENITNGIADGSGWWAPQWSPNGRYLAMLSTRGGNTCLWAWDTQTHTLRQVSTRAVDIDVQDVYRRPFRWVGTKSLMVSLMAEGHKPYLMQVELQTPEIATREWPKTPRGQETTASALDSGVPVNLARRAHGQLQLLDVATGAEKLVLDASSAEWAIAPRSDVVAVLYQTSIYLPKAGERLSPAGPSTFTFGVAVALRDGSQVELEGEASQDVLRNSLCWSPDGKVLAYLGYAGKDRSLPALLYRVDLATRTVTRQTLGELDAAPTARNQAQLKWTAGGHLMVLAAARIDDNKPPADARRDWWRIDTDGSRHCLSCELDAVPAELWPAHDSRSFVGLAKGELWRLQPDEQKVQNLTEHFKPQVSRLSWPATNGNITEWPQENRIYASMIFETGKADATRVTYRLDTENGNISAVPAPAPGAQLKAYSPDSNSAVFYRSDNDGLFAWRSDATTGRSTELMAANQFLRDVAEGEFRSIDYTSLNGKPLKAWVLLPPSYQKGERYPLLTTVYPGWVASSTPDSSDRIGSADTHNNIQVAAARGYVVLLPSMPLPAEGVASDPMLQLQDGVMPAVDKLVEMGIADPRRLFLIGGSFGGFATYGLITQTNRFTAAVALAGLSDLVSLYGQFDARARYTDNPQEHPPQMASFESGQLRMGNPPWKDIGRYLRNSPIFYVDRVNTPVLIIQGDMDYVAMQQGEEFFMSLYRQGKRARFVRYWGEGHMLQSPANIRDMWQRIFAWFDEFSPKQSGQPQAGEASGKQSVIH